MIVGNLEYLLCSLPYLSFRNTDEEQHKVFSLFSKYTNRPDNEMSVVETLDHEAVKYLSTSQFRLFTNIRMEIIHDDLFRNSDNSMVTAFSTFVYQQKKSVEQLRIARRKGADPNVVTQGAFALNPGNPLEEEVQLLRMQWHFIEDISCCQYDNFSALIVFKLKLLLLLRWWAFDRQQGFDTYLKLVKEDQR